MSNYKLQSPLGDGLVHGVFRGVELFIPFSPDNTDYQQFLEDWKNGAEVLNPDGTPAPYVAPETP